MPADANALIEMPCGTLLATASEKGLKGLVFLSPEDVSKWRRLLAFNRPTLLQKANLEAAKNWVKAYLDGHELPIVKIHLEGTDFQNAVWMSLQITEVGQTISYSELAARVGKPGASRAVGSAMAANPITVIVPCHRVVKTDGGMGNYSGYGGTDTKSWLLEHEAGIR